MRVKFKAAVAVWEMDLSALQVDRAGSRPVRGLVAWAEVVAAGMTHTGGWIDGRPRSDLVTSFVQGVRVQGVSAGCESAG